MGHRSLTIVAIEACRCVLIFIPEGQIEVPVAVIVSPDYAARFYAIGVICPALAAQDGQIACSFEQKRVSRVAAGAAIGEQQSCEEAESGRSRAYEHWW